MMTRHPEPVHASGPLTAYRCLPLLQESVRSLRILVTSYDRTELSADYGAEPLPLHHVGLTVLRRNILRHYAVRDPAGQVRDNA